MPDDELDSGERVEQSVRNEIDGPVSGSVVQAGSISGGIQQAHALGGAEIHQAGRDQYIAGRDLHLYFRDGVHTVRRVEFDAADQECPYPGLAVFGPEQARWFFGRDRLTAHLIERLDQRATGGGPLIVVAPSGAGKSSLLRAGLLPAIANGALPASGSRRWPCFLFTPTARPMAVLASYLAAVVGIEPARVAEMLVSRPRECVPMVRGALRNARLIMIIDQLEELYSLCADERERTAFLDVVSSMTEPGVDGEPAVGVVVCGLRADFYASAVAHPKLRAALQDGQIVVGPMSPTELREAILFPARAVGLEIEPGLVELLLRDLGSPYEAGRLPLLAHALRVTWQHRYGHVLTVSGYRATGGIHDAVAITAERVYSGLNLAGRHLAQALFLRLVRIGDGVEDTRRRVPHQEVLRGLDVGVAAATVRAFSAARLLTLDTDTVEITHEALLRAWPRLHQWINTDRAGNLTRQEIEDAAAGWARANRDTATLYRGSRLETARSLAALSRDNPLSPTAHAFVAASVRQHNRGVRVRRAVVALLSVLTLVAATSALVAFQQSVAARAERDAAIFNRISAEADRLRGTDISLAAQLDLVAHRMRPDDRNVYANLVDDASVPLSAPLTGHTNIVDATAFSPDGRTLVTAGADRTARLWNMTDLAHPRELGSPLPLSDRHAGVVFSAANSSAVFSPDGRTLATASMDLVVRLWNMTDPARPRPLGPPLTGHTDLVLTVAFSPDGRTLATGGIDKTVRLWDLTDMTRPRPLSRLTGHLSAVEAMTFSPDGRTLATAADDSTARLWNVTDPARPTPLGQPLTGHTHDFVRSAVFSPDGRTLVTTSGDSTARLWNVTDPAQPVPLGQPLTGHTDTVQAAAFSPDGRILATGGDSTVRLWNMVDPARPVPLGHPLTGHTKSIRSMAFAPDGRSLATAGDDQTVRLWRLPAVLIGHTDMVFAVAFGPDDRTMASASRDGTVRLWDVSVASRPKPLGKPLTGHVGAVVAVTFSRDGRTLASSAGNGEVRLWDVASPDRPEPVSRFTAGSRETWSVAFSRDGRTLATANGEGTVRLWNLADPARPVPVGRPLTGHIEAWSVAFSPHSDVLASVGHDQRVQLWNVIDPTRPQRMAPRLTGHTTTVVSVVFSPDGRTLASASGDSTVRLWDVTIPVRPRSLGPPLLGHTGAVLSTAFSPDGQTLASASHDKTVRLWDVADRTRPAAYGEPLTGHADRVLSVAFSPDGRTLASAGRDHTIRLWPLTVDDAIQRVCANTGQTLTPEHWDQYISDDLPYQPPCW